MMKKRKAWNKAIALLCAAALLFSVFPAGFAAAETAPYPAPHSGSHMLRADLKGDAGNWAYMEQEVDGIAANTDYSFGIWVQGAGIATLKVAAGGSTVSYTRPIATGEWTYHSVNFNSGSRSGKMTLSIVDSAATAHPQSSVAGVMYVDDAYLGTSGGGANLLQNAGFEAGSNLWNKLEKDVFSVVEGASAPEEPDDPEDPPVDTTVYTGARSLKAELAAKSSGWAYLTQKVTGIAAGTTYELGMWVKGAGAATLKLSQGSSSGGALAFVRQKATSSWTYWTADYTAATNDDLHVSIYDSAFVPGSGITQAEAQGTMRIDDVFLGVKGSGVNRLANPGFEASDALTDWTVANNSSPLVFAVAGGDAEHETPGGPVDPEEPTDPEEPVDPEEPGNPDDPANIHAGSRSMQAATKGKPNDWKTVTQQIGGIAAGTNYTFGAWLRGSGAVTIKVAKSNGENLHYIRPKATNAWTYASASFNSGTYAGTVVFSIVDSAGAAYPQAEAAGTMYADDVFFGAAAAGSDNLLLNPGFEQQLKYWGGDKGDVFTRYPDRSDNPPAQQYDGVDNLGVYSWDRNPDGVADFGEWIGRMPALAEDFLEQNTWDDLEGGNRLAAWEGTPFADRMIWAAYPFPKSGGSLAASANGDYNDHYRQLGENLVAAGMENAMIRFGHEFNGGWYIWSIGNANDPNHLQKAENFAEAFRQFVTTLRGVEGQNFKFVWNPSTSIWGVDLEAAFPGRDYVDFVGIDHYDQTWAQSGGKPLYGPEYRDADAAERLRRQELAWNAQINDGNWGLNMIARFAEDQGVPLGICEWGLALRADDGMGGGDNPYFIQKMYEWIENNNVAWHVYFNVSASDGDHDLYDTVAFPESSAKFAELWHPDGAPNTSPAIAPSVIPGIGGDYVKIEGEDGVLAGPVHKLHGDPWASGGQFAVMYRSVNSLTFANANKADEGIAIVYQGWQSDQKASLYVNNVLVKPNILFEEHGRSWSDSYGYVVIDDVQIPEGATVKLQINPDDVMDNWDNLKIDYILLLGATGEYVQPEVPGDGNGGGADAVSVPSRTSFTRSGVWSLTADVKGTGNTNGSSYSAQPTLTAGVTYEFGAWIKGSGRMALVIQNTTSWAEVLAKPFAATDVWQYVSATYTPAATGKYNIKIGDRDNSGTGGRIYVDDVRLSPLGGDPIIDENFEDGGSQWWHPAGHFAPVDYSAQGDSTDAHSGRWAMKLDAAAGEAGTAAVLSPPLPLAAGKTYSFKAWVKGGVAFSVRLSEAGEESQALVEESLEAGSGEWNEVSFSFIAGQTGNYELSLVSADDTGVLYLDDMLLFTNGFNNLLPNPDFEQGNVHWETDGAFAILNMDEIEMPDAAPVTANPDSGDIAPGQFVALSTTESGATIYYTIEGSATKLKYEAPIQMNGTTSITAWTEIDGKRKSPARTFSYVNAEDLLVDSYGQIRSAEFPGKIHNDEEFAAAAESDRAFLGSLTAPGDRDAYGGLAGSKELYGFEATGYFHIEKLNGKSVMVDPLGNLYFHLAVNGTGYVDETRTVVGGRESVYEWLPARSGEFATAYDGSGNFSFYIANEIRRTGQPFDQARYSADSVDFVKSLGFTGLGAWSNAAGMPYVDWLPMPDLKIGDSGLFDIFHPNMTAQMDSRFQSLAAKQDDGNLIGYMFANELRYDKLKTAVPASGASTGSKLRLVEMLEDKYGSIADFNAAWALDATSFEALKGLSFAAKTELATRDMDAYTKLYLDELYKQIALYTKKYDPGHLVMGDRWLANVMNDSKLRDYLAEYAGKYMDVLTYNYYTYDLNLDMLEHLYGLSGGTPFIMTEFHYGDPTTGLTFGARMAENETEKGLMYSNYVEKAAASGYVVGANWFAFLDQAPTGRWFQGLDGEAGAIGLLNVAGRPYRQFLQSVSSTNAKLYDLMLGSIAPYQYTFKPGQTERTSDKKLDVPQSATAPVIGDFEQPWDQAVTANLSDIDLVLGVMKQGIGARMNLTWDDEALYLRAHIDDPTPLSSPNVVKALTVPAAKAYLWAGDAIELFFGPDNVNDGGSMQFSDTQLLLAAAMDEQGVMHTASYWSGYREQEQPPVDMAAKLDADGQGYMIEARIAFADIGVDSAEDGTVIRYDMGFDEGGTKGRERQFFWNGVDGNSSNREKWGQIVLKAESPEPPATGGNGDSNGDGDSSSTSASASGFLVNGKPADVPVYDGNAYEIVMSENGGSASLTVSATELARMASEHPGSYALVKTPVGSYRLPTDWAAFVPGFDELLAAEGLTASQAAFRLTLADAASDIAAGQAVASQTAQGKLLAGVSFTLEVIHAVNGERIAELSEFKLPIVRTVALPTSADGSKELPELYGVWKLDETSGKLLFVPHRLLVENGKASVVISSMTNSTYIVASNAVSFKDVAAGMWYADAIGLAASKRLLIGTGGGAFAPSRSVTRAEFARMAANLLQLPAADANAPSYIDVPKRHAYYDAVSKLSAAGLLSGLVADANGRFLPDQAISREEMSVIIAAMANILDVEPSAEIVDLAVKFKDFASIRADYADDVRIAYELGIMQGVAAIIYEPQGSVSRAQAATVLVRMAERFGFIEEPGQ